MLVVMFAWFACRARGLKPGKLRLDQLTMPGHLPFAKLIKIQSIALYDIIFSCYGSYLLERLGHSITRLILYYDFCTDWPFSLQRQHCLRNTTHRPPLQLPISLLIHGICTTLR